MELAPAIFLAACVAAGYGLTYLIGLALSVEERLAFGTVIGAAAVSGVSLVISLVVVAAGILVTLLALFINRSKLGKAMRATAQDRDASQLMGININRTIAATFFIGARGLFLACARCRQLLPGLTNSLLPQMFRKSTIHETEWKPMSRFRMGVVQRF